jgi:hypothetical protein
MTAAIPPTFVEQAAILRELRGRERAQRRRQLEELFQVSSSTMSRWLHALSIVCHERSDKGKRVSGVKEEHLQTVFTIQYSSYKKTQGPIMPAADAIEIAERNGRIPAGILTPSSYNAWLRATGIGRDKVDTPEPHRDMVSLGPQHVHQADWSLAINWKIKNNKAVYDELVYKNKLPASGEPRLWRLLVTDHTSGMIFPWYTAAAGEDVTILIEGLWRAWTEKMYQGESIQHLYPFRGVPRILMLDRGPGTKSQVMQNFLAHLGVKLNVCEGARSKGQVEGAHWWWEQRFESRFRLDPVIDIERLNDDAVAFAAKICKEEIHSRTKATRTAHWEFHLNRSFETQLRVPNCDFAEAKRFAVSPSKIATVGGSGIIQFRGQRYRVPQALLYERKVSVAFSPFEFPSVYVRSATDQNAPQFLCQPLAFNEHGFPEDGVIIGAEFKSHKDSVRAQMVKDADRTVKEYVTAGERFVTRGYHLEDLQASGIKSRETEIEVSPEHPIYNKFQAREIVSQAIGGRPFSPAEVRYLARFSDQVTQEEIDDAIAAIQRGLTAAVVSMPIGG